MQVIITTVIVIASIIAMLLVLALFIPKNYSVSVAIIINQPFEKVYQYLSILKNQEQYSEWFKADPNLQTEILGTDGTIGAIQRWNSNIVGTGEQEILYLSKAQMEIELRLRKPMEGTCRLVNKLIERGNSATQYSCTFFAYAKYPRNLPSYLIGRRFIKKTQLKTLNNIKHILE